MGCRIILLTFFSFPTNLPVFYFSIGTVYFSRRFFVPIFRKRIYPVQIELAVLCSTVVLSNNSTNYTRLPDKKHTVYFSLTFKLFPNFLANKSTNLTQTVSWILEAVYLFYNILCPILTRLNANMVTEMIFIWFKVYYTFSNPSK